MATNNTNDSTNRKMFETVDNLAQQLNLFVLNFFKDKNKNNWRVQKTNDNELINYLKKHKNNIISTVNKLTYIDKDNYNNIEIYNRDIKNQKKLKNIFKENLKLEAKNIDTVLYDLFFKAKQNLLFKYTLNGIKINKFTKNAKYEYMLEKYIYVKEYKNNLKIIYKIIENNFINNEYVILDITYNLTKFTQIFIHDALFEDIKNHTISESKKQEILELLLDIKNKLINKVILYILHINMMIKHNVITYREYKTLLFYIKDKIEDGFNQPDNIIYTENNFIWCYYFIINYILYKDLDDYKYIFEPNIISKIYTKYKYLQYI